jgi:hypothetical protein
MAKKKLRQIVLDGKIYLWRFIPGYVKFGEGLHQWECRDRFIAYLQFTRKSPLQIHFCTWEDAVIGGPLRVGASLNLDNSGPSGINLHTPGWAAWLIRHALNAGWMPEQDHQPFVIERGMEFLIAMK